jgi:hypothetical protein
MNYICPDCRRAGKTEPSLSPYVTGEAVEDPPPAPPPETIEESDAFEDLGPGPAILRGDSCPWRPEDLPDRLRPYGHRLADQDGGDGAEWVAPWVDHQEQFLEAVRVTFEAREIPA